MIRSDIWISNGTFFKANPPEAEKETISKLKLEFR